MSTYTSSEFSSLPEHDTELLSNLAAYFDEHHQRILLRWRSVVDNDPRLTTASRLNRAEFEDNITASLQLLSHQLRNGQAFLSEEITSQKPNTDKVNYEETKHAHEHGLHRWQEGYDIRELTLEWGHLHTCLVEVVNNFDSDRAYSDRNTLNWARLTVAQLVNIGFSQSVIEYHRLQQSEAREIVHSLSLALKQLKDWERQRGQVLREAVHDLQGSLSTMQAATNILDPKLSPELGPDVHDSVLELLQRGGSSLNVMLVELLDLARLESGQEVRSIETVNISNLLSVLCDSAESIAQTKELYIQTEGPMNLLVEGDSMKIQRIAQNLLLNALKYTFEGGIQVSWAKIEINKWQLSIRDTGPGIVLTPGQPSIIQELIQSNEIDVLSVSPSQPFPPSSSAGEGIGIVIVKRLCALLDAQLEVETTVGVGSTFRVTFPRRYTTSE
jgi:signal transduction histidine kinase